MNIKMYFYNNIFQVIYEAMVLPFLGLILYMIRLHLQHFVVVCVFLFCYADHFSPSFPPAPIQFHTYVEQSSHTKERECCVSLVLFVHALEYAPFSFQVSSFLFLYGNWDAQCTQYAMRYDCDCDWSPKFNVLGSYYTSLLVIIVKE